MSKVTPVAPGQEIVPHDDLKDNEHNYDLAERKSARAKVRILCEEPNSSKLAEVYHTVFSLIIVVSICCYMFSSLNDAGKADPKNFAPETYKALEVSFTVLFTIDLIVRGLTADTCIRRRKHLRKNEEPHPPFLLDVLNLFDLLSVLPLPIEEVFSTTPGLEETVSAADLKLLGVFRVMRVFKIARHFDGTRVLATTLKRSVKPLVVSIFMLVAFGCIVAGLLFFFEPCYSTSCVLRDCYNTGYYIAITLTTVGYGDQIPTTVMGRMIGVFCMLIGSFYMAMPLAVIGSRFEEAFQEREKEKAALSEEYEKLVLRSLQGVTRRQRRDRICRLGYQVAESLDELQDNINDLDGSVSTKKKMFDTLHTRLLQFSMDLRVLFKLKAPISLTASTGKQDVDSFWDADLYTGDDMSLDDVGVDKLEDIHREHRLYYEEIMEQLDNARNKKSIRSKIWLLMEVKDSSKWARRLHNLRLLVTALSILVCFAETMPEMNDFGEESRVCSQVVGYYCERNMSTPIAPAVFDDDQEALNKQNNRGCFPSTDMYMVNHVNAYLKANGDNLIEPYGGCMVEDLNKPSDCKFPSPGFTCSQPDVPEGNSTVDKANYVLAMYYGRGLNGTESVDALFTKWSREYAMSSALWRIPFDPALRHLQYPEDFTAICERIQCTETYNPINKDSFANYTDKGEFFMLCESFFALFFIMELILRLFTVRNYRHWLSLKANIVDVVAIMTTVFEVLYVPYAAGKFTYEVWGNGALFDPATFRVFRVLVSIRFITMQRHFSGLQVIIKTVELVKGKMAIPLFFLFIFVTLFASVFNFFERGALYECPTFNPDVGSVDKSKCTRCTHESHGKLQKGFGNNKTVTNRLYDGSCSLMVEIYTGDGPEVLAPTAIENVFDAWWTTAVTMTTVGYGGKYPVRAAGKFVAIAAAMVGTFYLAMPLTIIGTQFYDVYTQVEEEDAEDAVKREMLFHPERFENEDQDDGNISDVQRKESFGHVSLGTLSRIKKMSLRRKKRNKEDLTDVERRRCEEYVTAAGSVRASAEDHSVEELDKFFKQHIKLMVIISAKFYRDFDQGGIKMIGSRD